ncbi:MAG: SGNH/GDSL hydrolase family protein [Armatimonadetes bacterium]|nr:SGNH/GDSL hydrolase family protein [Armatimonadota bacterium]
MMSITSLALAGDETAPPTGGRKPEPAPPTGSKVDPAWKLVPPSAHPEKLGANIQRTMRLLATSTPQKRNHVRILFYGQSITEQDWTKQVAADLRRRFPYADLEIENRAIGGFASQLLIRPAEHDVYPFYPDLVIFHVYGSDKEYEEIIRRIRSRTTAEVLMQRDHVAASGVDPNATPDTDKGKWWDNVMNGKVLPEIAAKYGCGLADVRGEWLRYLSDNALLPQALLKDGVHLNEHGNFVMSQIVSQSLVYRADLPAPKPTVREYAVGKDAKFIKNRLSLPFTGNRVELLPGAAFAGNVRVLVDGKPVSAHPVCFAFTRPAPNPWASPLSLSLVESDAPLIAEDWTLTVTKVVGDDPKTATWEYAVRGSVTGEDGVGTSDKPFVSKSRRVKISPESFFRGHGSVIPVGHTITWQSYLRGADTIALKKNANPATENVVLLVSGLSSGAHMLELIADGAKTPPAIKGIRVFTPRYPTP